MTIETVVKVLMASPLLFGAVGFLLGLFSSSPYIGGLVWMGVCFGAFVGACAAAGCLCSSGRIRYSHLAALCVNSGLFIVVAREMQILG